MSSAPLRYTYTTTGVPERVATPRTVGFRMPLTWSAAASHVRSVGARAPGALSVALAAPFDSAAGALHVLRCAARAASNERGNVGSGAQIDHVRAAGRGRSCGRVRCQRACLLVLRAALALLLLAESSLSRTVNARPAITAIAAASPPAIAVTRRSRWARPACSTSCSAAAALSAFAAHARDDHLVDGRHLRQHVARGFERGPPGGDAGHLRGKSVARVGGIETEITSGRVELTVELGGEELVDLVGGERSGVVHGVRGL